MQEYKKVLRKLRSQFIPLVPSLLPSVHVTRSVSLYIIHLPHLLTEQNLSNQWGGNFSDTVVWRADIAGRN
jgi:hypothetical protein